MARLSVMTFCLSHTHDKHYRHRWRLDIEVSQFDEQFLRELLQKNLKRFSRRTFCHEPGGWLIADQDIAELRARNGVVLVDTTQDDRFMPNALTCANCGWKTEPSSTYYIDGDRVFCHKHQCRVKGDAARKEAFRQKLAHHQQEGLCVYRDEQPTAAYELCPNPVLPNSDLCNDHYRRPCEKCGAQAYRTYWEFGSLGYAHYRCLKH